MTRYPVLDRSLIQLKPIAERGHDITASQVIDPATHVCDFVDQQLECVVAAIREARRRERPVIVMMGGHPIKLGLSRFLIELMQQQLITHVAMNGAGIIHDFELACFGGTSESVAKWIKVGQFGLWSETNGLNRVISEAFHNREGLGEGVGRFLSEHAPPHETLSIAAAGYHCKIPVTCHVTIGGDIIHSMADCDGAALGGTSYTDFLIFAGAIQQLEGGVFLNIGSAVTGPEVYLKALSMARNIARQEGKELHSFTTAVFDFVDLPSDWCAGTPSKSDPGYYYRPWKTILIRTVADGGTSYYIRGDHFQTIPMLWSMLSS
jgi:hypothetical protein